MDGVGGLVLLALIWIVGSIFDQKKKQQRRRQQAKQVPPPSIEVESVSGEPRSTRPDSSQREGSRLEEVLRQLNPELADLADQVSRGSRQPVMVRKEPQAIAAAEEKSDFVAKAEAAIARRRKVADDRIRDRTDQDHESFHQQARLIEEPVIAGPAAAAPSLRQAIIWREILGPPKAFTIDED